MLRSLRVLASGLILGLALGAAPLWPQDWPEIMVRLEDEGWTQEVYDLAWAQAEEGNLEAITVLTRAAVVDRVGEVAYLEGFLLRLVETARGGDSDGQRFLAEVLEVLPPSWDRRLGASQALGWAPPVDPEGGEEETSAPDPESGPEPELESEVEPEADPGPALELPMEPGSSPVPEAKPEPELETAPPLALEPGPLPTTPVASAPTREVAPTVSASESTPAPSQDPGAKLAPPLESKAPSGEASEPRLPPQAKPDRGLGGSPFLLLLLGLGLGWGLGKRAPSSPAAPRGPGADEILDQIQEGDLSQALKSASQLSLEELSLKDCYRLGRGFEDAGLVPTARGFYLELDRREENYLDARLRLDRLGQGPGDLPEEVLQALPSRYREIEPLGRGGMGLTFKVKDQETQRWVALKTPGPWVKKDPKVRRRFLREARTLAALEHPALVRIYDVSREDPLYFTMEYLPGKDLAERLRTQGPLSVPEALAWIRPVAEAVALLHKEGLVHRDIKPSNLFLGADGELRLGDFGLVHDSEATHLTATGAALGTLSYAAPEQFLGGEVHPSVDSYALAGVLYEMLTGTPPFGHAEASRKLQEPAKSLDQRLPGAPQVLVQFLDRCLDRDPKNRPSEGAAWLQELTRVQEALENPRAQLGEFLTRLRQALDGPLHTLKNRVQLAAQAQEPIPEEFRQKAEEALLALACPSNLPAQILRDFAELQVQVRSSDPVHLRGLSPKARELLENFRLPVREVVGQVAASHPNVEVEGDGFPLPPLLVADPDGGRATLSEMLENLIQNAEEAGASQVRLWVGTGEEGEEEWAEVRVQDNGPGFPEAQRARVFQGPLEDRGEGRGTGLWTLARKARARGWEVSLDPGLPTCLRLCLRSPWKGEI